MRTFFAAAEFAGHIRTTDSDAELEHPPPGAVAYAYEIGAGPHIAGADLGVPPAADVGGGHAGLPPVVAQAEPEGGAAVPDWVHAALQQPAEQHGNKFHYHVDVPPYAQPIDQEVRIVQVIVKGICQCVPRCRSPLASKSLRSCLLGRHVLSSVRMCIQVLAQALYGCDCVLVIGAPGCGKTHLISSLVRTFNRARIGSAVLCAHSAHVGFTIGGRSIASQMHYGFWSGAPLQRYINGKESSVAEMELVAVEETQQAGPHMLEDLADRKRTAHEQVRQQLPSFARETVAIVRQN